jgi:two-component system, LuxR family, response regulator FixJ
MDRVVVYLVDDDASFLRAQSRMLRAAGLSVCGFTSPAEFLREISLQTRGCVVTDLSMPDMSGLQLQEALAKAGAELPLVFLTGHGDIPSSVHAMRGGAVDFLEKCAAQENLLAAIRKALTRDAGDHEARTRFQALHDRFSRLTPREREVLRHVVRGAMNKQIAATLGISERTVKLHRTAITAKAGVHSPALLATLARDAKLFDSEGLQELSARTS